MCGIAGIWDIGRKTPAARLAANGRAMADALHHRGPDQGDVWTDAEAGIALGFRRLAIVDLSPTGHQPMTSADGRFVMTYNGEIYNFRELAADLTGNGHTLRGSSDSEVMLELFARDGVAATLPRLVGMFAIALWDRRERRLTLIRDRLGIKPLYWGRQGSRLFWGSELKAIRAHPDFAAAVDPSALDGFLKHLCVGHPGCIYRDLNSLSPGSYAEIGPDGEARIESYWSLADVAAQAVCEMDATQIIDRTEALLREAVGLRMIADVPLGALLSGGIDSSAVVALMQAQSDRPVKTFTIGFGHAEYDEAAHAEAVATHLGTDHTALTLTPEDARDLIPSLPDWYDEPFADSSALPTYLVSKLARESVTVALSGDGGDETFFGYNRHRVLGGAAARLDGVPKALRRMGAAALLAPGPAFWDTVATVLPRGRRPRMVGDKAGKLARLVQAENADARYLSTITHWREDLTGLGRAPCIPPGGTALDPSARAAFADMAGYLPNDILTKVDRASMAVSLEARVPLLDHRLVEFAWSLPTGMKLKDGQSKWPLRQVLYRHVPRSLVDRPKTGFAVPLADWLRGPLRDWAETLLSEERLRARGLVDPAPVRRQWTAFQAGRSDRAEALWAVCMLESWAGRWMGRP